MNNPVKFHTSSREKSYVKLLHLHVEKIHRYIGEVAETNKTTIQSRLVLFHLLLLPFALFLQRPWSHLRLPCETVVREIFCASTSWTLSNSKSCKFWTNPWLDGAPVTQLAPTLAAFVHCCRRNHRLACDAIPRQPWI